MQQITIYGYSPFSAPILLNAEMITNEIKSLNNPILIRRGKIDPYNLRNQEHRIIEQSRLKSYKSQGWHAPTGYGIKSRSKGELYNCETA